MLTWVSSSSWTQCGQPHRIWPARISARSAVCGLGSRMTSHSATSSARLRRPGDAAAELLVTDAERLPVAALQVDPFPQVSRDPAEMKRMDREPALVLLPRPGSNAEAELLVSGH